MLASLPARGAAARTLHGLAAQRAPADHGQPEPAPHPPERLSSRPARARCGHAAEPNKLLRGCPARDGKLDVYVAAVPPRSAERCMRWCAEMPPRRSEQPRGELTRW